MRREFECSTVGDPYAESGVIKDAFKSARHDARDSLLANHPELGAGSLPPLPPGYGVPGVRQSMPVPRSLPGGGVPPLPPGYILHGATGPEAKH